MWIIHTSALAWWDEEEMGLCTEWWTWNITANVWSSPQMGQKGVRWSIRVMKIFYQSLIYECVHACGKCVWGGSQKERMKKEVSQHACTACHTPWRITFVSNLFKFYSFTIYILTTQDKRRQTQSQKYNKNQRLQATAQRFIHTQQSGVVVIYLLCIAH